MKHVHSLSFLSAILLGIALPTAPASAQMNYQGRLTDSSGNALADGQYNLEFRVFTAATGGTELWGPFNATAVDLLAGRFNTVIGATDTTNRSLATALAGTAFLQIKVGSNPPIAPRQQILASPKALRADVATAVVDGGITTNQLANGSVTAAKLASSAGVWSTSASGVYRDTSNGSVGIGNALPLPAARLHVSPVAYGQAPTAIFEGQNCGFACVQPGWTEIVRLWNSNSNGRAGLGFMTRANGAVTEVPDVYVGTGDVAGANSNDFRIATNVSNVLTERFFLDGSTGKVGIGTVLPVAAFQVAVSGSSVNNGGMITAGDDSSTHLAIDVDDIQAFSDSAAYGTLYLNDYGGNINMGNLASLVQIDGRLGIGTNASRGRLEVSGAITTAMSAHRYISLGLDGTDNPANYSRDISIYATDGVMGHTFRAFSDRRIKKDIHVTDNAADLKTLLALQISDYRYVDEISKGTRPQKKLIAQQVETVYPLAVDRSTDVVPDLYRKAEVTDGWVMLATDLKPGDRVRLIGHSGESMQKVAEVRDGAFRPADRPADSTVFVYGREVDDFRSVDYEAVSMLNVSATQELARQMKAKDEKIAALEDRLATLEKSLARLAASLPTEGEGAAKIRPVIGRK